MLPKLAIKFFLKVTDTTLLTQIATDSSWMTYLQTHQDKHLGWLNLSVFQLHGTTNLSPNAWQMTCSNQDCQVTSPIFHNLKVLTNMDTNRSKNKDGLFQMSADPVTWHTLLSNQACLTFNTKTVKLCPTLMELLLRTEAQRSKPWDRRSKTTCITLSTKERESPVEASETVPKNVEEVLLFKSVAHQ